MSISAALHMVLDEPVSVLNAIEDKDILTGRKNTVHAFADQNVNNAIAFTFIPRFEADFVGGVEHLRCVLSSSAETEAQCDS